jgi:hypothetical protein
MGILSYEDFDDALGQLLPVAPTKINRVRYKLAEQDSSKDNVQVTRLAEIACCISLYCCYKNNWAPQAFVNPEFSQNQGEGRGGGDDEDSGGSKGASGVGAVDQEEVDELLRIESNVLNVNHKAVEEEEKKLLKVLM